MPDYDLSVIFLFMLGIQCVTLVIALVLAVWLVHRNNTLIDLIRVGTLEIASNREYSTVPVPARMVPV